MEPFYHDLYDGKSYTLISPIRPDCNDPQLRYGQLVGLTFYVSGRPRAHFRERVSLYSMQAFSIQSHQTYCKLAPLF